MKLPWISALLNFFFMGPGYIYNGKRKLLGVLLTLAAIGLTYVENIHQFAEATPLSGHDSTAFMVLFASVFIANTALAIDGYREAKAINSSQE